MKIAIVTDAWHPQVNGVVTTLNRTRACLEALGHGVAVFTPEPFSSVPCPTYPEIRLALQLARRLAKLLTAYAPDAIHVATEGSPDAATASGRAAGLPRRITHSSRSICANACPSRKAGPTPTCAITTARLYERSSQPDGSGAISSRTAFGMW